MKLYAMYDLQNKEQCVGIFDSLKEISRFINNNNLRSLSSAISHKRKLKNRYEVKILEKI